MKTSNAVLVAAAVFGAGQAAFWLWPTASDQPTPATHQPLTNAVAPAINQTAPQPRTIVSTAPPAGSPSDNLTDISGTRPSHLPRPSDFLDGNHPLPEIDPDTPMSREELERRAQIVQDQTQRRLENLTRDLNLTDDQQDYLFGVIARSSPSYVPALNIGYLGGTTNAATGGGFTPIKSGSTPRTTDSPSVVVSSQTDSQSAFTTASVNDKIYEVLAPDQQDAFEEDLMDRDRWWSDIIGELEAEHDEIIAGEPVVTPPKNGDGTPDKEITTGEDGESTEQTQGGGNLFDLLKGN